MLLAVRLHLTTLDVNSRFLQTEAIRGTSDPHVHHTILSMLPAVSRHFSLDIEARSLGARVMRATPVANVHHAVRGMSLAAHRRLAARKVEARSLGAGVL